MMEIILARHGKPDFPVRRRIASQEISQLVRAYDAAPLDASSTPPPALVDIARTCVCVVCSDLPRSTGSAARLGVSRVHLADPLFREAGLPHTSLPLPMLPPYLWFTLFRVLWFAGFCANGESLAEAKARAGRAAQALKAMAARHGTVLFVGHGLLNSLIARHLRAGRWQGPRSPGTGHWDFSVYRFGRE